MSTLERLSDFIDFTPAPGECLPTNRVSISAGVVQEGEQIDVDRTTQALPSLDQFENYRDELPAEEIETENEQARRMA